MKEQTKQILKIFFRNKLTEILDVLKIIGVISLFILVFVILTCFIGYICYLITPLQNFFSEINNYKSIMNFKGISIIIFYFYNGFYFYGELLVLAIIIGTLSLPFWFIYFILKWIRSNWIKAKFEYTARNVLHNIGNSYTKEDKEDE
jgi:hypothetical protein